MKANKMILDEAHECIKLMGLCYVSEGRGYGAEMRKKSHGVLIKSDVFSFNRLLSSVSSLKVCSHIE